MEKYLISGAAMDKRGHIVPVEFEQYERYSEVVPEWEDRLMFRLVCYRNGLEPMEIFEREYLA